MGIPQYHLSKLQTIQNAMVRLMFNLPRRSSVRQHLRDLHWLPVVHRVQFKALTLIHRALHGLGPLYLRKRFSFYTPNRSLRSVTQRRVSVPRFCRTNWGGQSLSVKAASAWNSLPEELRHIQDFGLLKKHLKTFLFNQLI